MLILQKAQVLSLLFLMGKLRTEMVNNLHKDKIEK